MVTGMLETIDLTKSNEGRVVVDHVNLKIHAGEVAGLLGPNGAGKTTAFYVILNLVLPDNFADYTSLCKREKFNFDDFNRFEQWATTIYQSPANCSLQ